MRIFDLGAGVMGRAVVYDLGCARDVKHIAAADFDRDRAHEVARTFGDGKARGHFADVRQTQQVAKLARSGKRVRPELFFNELKKRGFTFRHWKLNPRSV